MSKTYDIASILEMHLIEPATEGSGSERAKAIQRQLAELDRKSDELGEMINREKDPQRIEELRRRREDIDFKFTRIKDQYHKDRHAGKFSDTNYFGKITYVKC